MTYQQFLALRQERWRRFAAALPGLEQRRPRLSHDELEAMAVGFRQILSDHALAQSRFPGSAAARHLNALAARGNRALHWEVGDKKRSLSAMLRSFRNSVRLHRVEIATSLALFAVAVLMGLSLSAVEPSVGTAFVGREAVQGLEEGRLWTQALEHGSGGYFASTIASNNLGVALTAWLGGAFLGLGSLWVVILNGLLLGAVLSLVMHFGLGTSLLEFIAAHGPLELTLILVAAAAGLRVGRSLVEGGVEPRARRLATAARESVALLAGCLPWFVVLALVETYVSPSALPVGGKAAVGAALEILFLSLALGWWVDRPNEHRLDAAAGQSLRP